MHIVEYAYAAAQAPGGQGGGSMLVQVAFFAAIFAIFYFLLIRPQQKQRRDRETMLSAVKPGDRVVMSSGLHGTIVKLTVRVSPSRWPIRSDSSSIGRPSAASCRPRPTEATPPDAAPALAPHRAGGGGGGGLDLLSLSAAQDHQSRSRSPGRHPPRAGRGHRQGPPDPDRPHGGARTLEPGGEGSRRAEGGAPG